MNQDHLLNDSWTFSYNMNDSSFDKTDVVKIGEFNTVENFWEIFSHIIKPSKIKNSFYLFRKNYEPFWEDNIGGGEYQILFDTKNQLNSNWGKFVLSLIGEQFSPKVIGIVAQNSTKKKQYPSLKIWISKSGDENNLTQIITNIAQKVLLKDGTCIKYKSFEEKSKQSKTEIIDFGFFDSINGKFKK